MRCGMATQATRLVPKELAKRPERLAPGHRLCAGCGASIVVRQILAAIDDPVVIDIWVNKTIIKIVTRPRTLSRTLLSTDPIEVLRDF